MALHGDRDEPLLDRYVRSVGPDQRRRNPFVRSTIRRYRSLATRGIHSAADLHDAFERLPRATKSFAVWTLGFMGNSRDVPLLLRVFRDEPSLRQVVVGALPFLGGKHTYGLAVRLVESVIRASPVDGVTASDAVELLGSFCRYYEPEIEQPVSLLIDVIQSLDLPADARASAACCLGHILERSDRRRRPWRRAAAAILEAIADSEAEVRHEAAHAAGDMRLNDAIPQLEAMAKADPGRGPWGAVAREARGALYAIEHGEWPEWWWEGGDAD